MKAFFLIAAIALAPSVALAGGYQLIEDESKFGIDRFGKWTGAIVYTQPGCVPCKRLRAALDDRSSKGWVVANVKDRTAAHWLFVDLTKDEADRIHVQSTPEIRFFKNGKFVRSVKSTELTTVSALVRLHPDVKPQAMASVSDDYDLSEPSLAEANAAAAVKAEMKAARSEGYNSGYEDGLAAGVRSANCSVSRSVIMAGGPSYSYGYSYAAPATTYYAAPAATYYYAPNVSYSYGGYSYSAAAASAPVQASQTYVSPLWGAFGSSTRTVGGPAASFGGYGAYGASRAVCGPYGCGF